MCLHKFSFVPDDGLAAFARAMIHGLRRSALTPLSAAMIERGDKKKKREGRGRRGVEGERFLGGRGEEEK